MNIILPALFSISPSELRNLATCGQRIKLVRNNLIWLFPCVFLCLCYTSSLSLSFFYPVSSNNSSSPYHSPTEVAPAL